ncbi:Os06g0170200, partial [Oryza sativa Japonica Group]
VVDYHQCTLESLEKDLAARVKWGSSQHVVISGYDMSTGEETLFKDNMDVAHALFVRKSDRKLILFRVLAHPKDKRLQSMIPAI